MKTFNVNTNPLEGRNLIQASAGTGKTYSIALLVIRLIAEKGMDIKKILMVTFTNAAVAELEGRIRGFIKQANTYVSKNSKEGISDEIVKILDDAIPLNGEKKVRQALKLSLLHLDETSIFTIHSFCQRTLTEFAFETNQAFESELVSDTESIVEEAVNNYWRERITVIDVDLLNQLQLSLPFLKKCVSNQLNKEIDDSSTQDESASVLINYRNDRKEQEAAWEKMVDYYNQNQPLIIQESQSGRQNKTFSEIAHNREEFLETYFHMLTKAGSPQYMQMFLPGLKTLAEEYDEVSQKIAELIEQYYFFLVRDAVLFARKEIDRKKLKQGILFYDDLIRNLYDAVKGTKKDVLISSLNKKYEAVFIDEFHDTDKLQYEIFYSLFGEKSIMFLIGDPKQSIYGWRGADLETYKEAASQAETYTMDKNFRSTGKYIDAINALYAPVDDPFLDEEITYKKVKQGQDVGVLHKGSEEVIPLSVIYNKTKPIASEQVAAEINNLLTNNYFIETINNRREVKPSDIAVLVRWNSESPGIKKELVRLGIPAITYDDTQVLKSDEARSVLYILSAMIKPDKANINRAVATKFTGKTNDDILSLDDEQELERFRNLNNTLADTGIYSAMMEFARFYQVQKMSMENENGERIISNFLQIAELLQKRETEKGQSPEQLVNWLQRINDGETTAGDEYLQRVESDENAVTISTIHKSKGLAYNIVFAPFLNMKYRARDRACEDEDNEIEIRKTEQENRRLMYVTLTRAVYKSYIHIISSEKGTIQEFEGGLNQMSGGLVEKIEVEPADEKYVADAENGETQARNFKALIDHSWRILSFSGLSKSHHSFLSNEVETETTDFDDFVFNRLPKGIVAGLFLHEIFENIDFTDQSGWEKEIIRVGNKYSISVGDDISLYNKLIGNILNANYTAGAEKFTLSKLPSAKKINELEFYFKLNEFRAGELKKLLNNVSIDSYSYEGAMHGFVDLFFKMNGKYYILDWKSNYLGNTVVQYSAERLEEAMTANNYHLQYLIYSIAVKRFLENKIVDFDYDKHYGGVFYVFLRGCREGKISGLFYNKPEFEIIQKIDGIFCHV